MRDGSNKLTIKITMLKRFQSQSEVRIFLVDHSYFTEKLSQQECLVGQQNYLIILILIVFLCNLIILMDYPIQIDQDYLSRFMGDFVCLSISF